MKNNHLKSGLILSYTAIFIQSLVSLIYTPFLLRTLGQTDYGLLQLAISAIANLNILSFGFTGSYMRFYAPYRTKSDFTAIAKLNGMFFILFVFAAFLAVIAGGFISVNAPLIFSRSMTPSQTDTLKILLLIMTANIAMTFLCNIFDMYIASQEQFTFQKILIILTALLNPLITIPLLVSGHGNIAAALCITAVTAVKLIISVIYCVKKLNMQFEFSADMTVLKQITVFSFFIFLNIVSDQINWNVDKTILGIFKGSENVTLYSVASQINSYFLTFSYALCTILTPRAHTIVAENRDSNYLTNFFIHFSRIQLIIMMYIFMLFIAVGKPFMRLWSGIDSDIPYFTALILISPIILTSSQAIGIEIQRAKNLHYFRSVVYIIIALINIAVSIPLCVRFGEIGCALGTCACLFIGNIVIMNFYYHKRVGLNMIKFWHSAIKLLPVFIPAAAAAVIFSRLTGDSIISVIIGAAVVTAVYALSILFIPFNKDARADVINILKIRKR